MNTPRSRPLSRLLCALVFLAALTMLANCATRDDADVKAASTVSLVGTPWRLTQLGDEVVDNPAGAREIHLVLQSKNQRITGFSGCNQMMGAYALSGDELK